MLGTVITMKHRKVNYGSKLSSSSDFDRNDNSDVSGMLDVVVIGHIAIDTNVLPWGTVENILGGASTYAGMALNALKKNVGIISKVGVDFKEFSFYSKHNIDIKGISIGGERTIRYKNIYDPKEDREQVCEYNIPPLTPTDIPKSYLKARSFYISPIVNEVDVDIVKHVKRRDNIVMLDPQGLFRRIAKDGRVEITLPKGLDKFLRYVDIVKIGKAEASAFKIGVEEILSYLIHAGPKIAIVTLGKEGCIYLTEDKIEKVRSIEVDAKDFTGAGDVFGATFLAIYMDTLNVREAIKFASISAGLKIRRMGLEGFPTKEKILRELSLIDLTPYYNETRKR